MPSSSLRVRRSPHLVSYWRDKAIITRNYATGHAVIGDPLVSHVLTLCTDWVTVPQLRRQLPTVSRRTLQDLIGSMIDQHLLLGENQVVDPRELKLSTWAEWNPAAGFFHFTTKNMPRLVNLQRAELQLRQELKSHPVPSPGKRYPRAKVVKLPATESEDDFSNVLRRRRTWRSFSPQPVSLNAISMLLQLTWGVQRTEEIAGLGPAFLKTSPSSGARQPLEAYLLAVNVDGLPPGLYHYVADAHCLELIKPGATSRAIAKYIPGQWWYESAAAVFMMTAVFGRTQWRYPFPRAYRSVLLEAGHVCQTFLLVATWLGLAPFCTGRFSDAAVERDLRIDGVTESFIYGAGVGTRPPGVEWAPWPLETSKDSPFEPPRRRRRSQVGVESE